MPFIILKQDTVETQLCHSTDALNCHFFSYVNWYLYGNNLHVTVDW